jgi:hypothetical protein
MSDQERVERAAVQLAWEMSSTTNQARWVAPINVWKSKTERGRNRYRRMAAAILAAAGGQSMGAA